MKNLEIEIVPYYDDNFAYLIHDIQSNKTALVDCGEVEPVLRRLDEKKWQLDTILVTHFHFDHAGEIDVMKKSFPEVTVIKPAGENRLDVEGVEVKDGDTIFLGSTEVSVISLPAHTMFCTAYLADGNLFVGDALFSAGCGRLFEGQATDLERAMDKVAALSDDTNVYFGHEYTVSNIGFAKSVEPGNVALEDYRSSVDMKIGSGQFSTPTTVGLEKSINPFLRIDQPDVIKSVDPENKLNRTERMGALRSMKDNF